MKPAGQFSLGRSLLPLDNKGTPLNRVHEDEAALEEGVVAPGTDKIDRPAVGVAVILWVDVEEADLLDELSRGVLRQGRHVKDAQASAIVALVRKAVNDELVVVNAVRRALEVARLLGLLERPNVPEVGDRVATGGGARLVVLVVLVVEYEVLLPLRVRDPTLMGVCT